MKVYLGADHRGFNLKEELKKSLVKNGYQVEDLGDDRLDPADDYVDFAAKVAESVSANPDSLGILLCGSGVGVDIVANKTPGIRSALAFDLVRVKQAREHEDANVLSLPADILNPDLVVEMAEAFLTTAFSNEERHIRRLDKLKSLEEKYDR